MKFILVLILLLPAIIEEQQEQLRQDNIVYEVKNIWHKTSVKNLLSLFPRSEPSVVNEVVKNIDLLTYSDFPRREDILAVISVESKFRRCVTDGKGSWGLMQVNFKSSAKGVKEKDMCDVVLNLFHGVQLLRNYFLMFHSERAALIAYNVGPKNYLEGNYNEGYYDLVLAWKGKFSS